MTWLEDVHHAGVAAVAAHLGFRVAETRIATVTPCPACGAEIRSTGSTSGRPDRRPPVRLSRDQLFWHCHAGACKTGGDALGFACLALFGEARLSRGDARWRELRQRLAVPDSDVPRAAPRTPPIPAAPCWPPAAEVRALWESAHPVTDDADVSAWAGRRPGLDLQQLELFDVARVLPAEVPCPRWARHAEAAWSCSGHRLLAPLVDPHGRLRSLRARHLGGGEPKELAPTGHEVGGLVLACPLARALFGGSARVTAAARERVRANGLVIVEGTPAFWGWLSAFSDADENAPAVIGIASGGWQQVHADAVAAAGESASVRVILDVDPDPGGERLADQVLPSLDIHARARRVCVERRERTTS